MGVILRMIIHDCCPFLALITFEDEMFIEIPPPQKANLDISAFFVGQLTTKITQICCRVEPREHAQPAAQLALASIKKSDHKAV